MKSGGNNYMIIFLRINYLIFFTFKCGLNVCMSCLRNLEVRPASCLFSFGYATGEKKSQTELFHYDEDNARQQASVLGCFCSSTNFRSACGPPKLYPIKFRCIVWKCLAKLFALP